MKKRRRLIIGLIVIVIVVGGIVGARILSAQQLNSLVEGLETREIEQGTLLSLIEADGQVYSEQDAILTWDTSGEVLAVAVEVGDTVSSGDVLASLDQETLSAHVILAQADLVSAQKALDDLLNSRTQSAQAKKAVEDAERALEDAFESGLAPAQALVAIAEAERLLESAERSLGILITPPSEMSVQQVYSNILLTKDVIKDLEEQVADLEKTLNRAEFHPFESYSLYKTLYRNAQMELARQRDRLVEREERHAELLAPPDSLDLMIAEAKVAAAKANLADVQRQWERIKDGPTDADLAVLEANLSDARREWERVKDGPTQEDIVAAEAQVAAAQAALNTVQIIAPFDGVITQVEIQPGDQVNAGTAAFRLDDLSRLVVDLKVSEIDINKIELGQDVMMFFDSVLAKEYKGKVEEISPVGEVEAGVVAFDVSVELVDADESIRLGMTSSVNVEIGRVEQALLIPSQAIRSLEGLRVVYVLGSGIAKGQPGSNPQGSPSETEGGLPGLMGGNSPLMAIHPVPITIGISSSEYSEVVGGELKEGDVIILDPPIELLNQATR